MRLLALWQVPPVHFFEGPLECIQWPLAWRLLFYKSSPIEPELVLLDEEAVVDVAHTRKPRDTSPSSNRQASTLHKRKRGCSPSTMYKKHRGASPRSSRKHHAAFPIPDSHRWRSYPCIRRSLIVTTDRGLWLYCMPLTFGIEETEVPRPPKRPASSAFPDTPTSQPNHHPARDLCHHSSKRSRHALGIHSQAMERFTVDLQGRIARRRRRAMQNIPKSWTHGADKVTRRCVEEEPVKGSIRLQGGHGVGGQSPASSNPRELLYLRLRVTGSYLVVRKGLPLMQFSKTWISTFHNEDSNPDCRGLPTTTLHSWLQSITVVWADPSLCWALSNRIHIQYGHFVAAGFSPYIRLFRLELVPRVVLDPLRISALVYVLADFIVTVTAWHSQSDSST